MEYSISLSEEKAFRPLKEAASQGKPWPLALLEAIALWTKPREVYRGREYRYLIDNEAFDWRLLALRLSSEVDGLLPQEELASFVAPGRLPGGLSPLGLRRLLGWAKYRACLNYWYGVEVEKALLQAVAEEVAKERRCAGLAVRGTSGEAHRRLYGASRRELLTRFSRERGRPASSEEEFTYWLFKHRLGNSERAKVASDTKKALKYLEKQLKSGLFFR